VPHRWHTGFGSQHCLVLTVTALLSSRGFLSRTATGAAACLLAALIAVAPVPAQTVYVTSPLKEADRAFRNGDFRTAGILFDRAFTEEAESAGPGAYAKRAAIFGFLGQADAGVRWLEQVAEQRFPGHGLLLQQKAVLLASLPRRTGEALAAARRGLERLPRSYGLHLLLADLCLRRDGNCAEAAVTAFERYLRLRPARLRAQDPGVRIKLGRAHLLLGKPGAAQRPLAEALHQLRTTGGPAELQRDALRGLCQADAALRAHRQAVQHCSEAIGLDPRGRPADPESLLALARAHLALGLHQPAQRAAERLLRERSAPVAARLTLGDISQARRRWDQAEQHYLAARALAPADRAPLLALGRLYLTPAWRRPQAAVEVLASAERAGSPNAELLLLLGRAHAAAGNPSESARSAERGLAVAQSSEMRVALHVVQGDGLRRQGQLDAAAAAFRAALAVRAAHPAAQRGLCRTLNALAVQAARGNQRALAEQHLRDAAGLDPEEPATYLNRGLLALASGELALARQQLAERVRRVPGDSVALQHLARASAASGALEAASEQFAQARLVARNRGDRSQAAEIEVDWAEARMGTGDHAGAIDLLDSAITVLPTSSRASELLAIALCRHAHDQLRARQWGQAIAAASRALQPGPAAPALTAFCRLTQGLAYLGEGAAVRAQAVLARIDERALAPWLLPQAHGVVQLYRLLALSAADSTEALEAAVRGLRSLLRDGWEPVRSQARTQLVRNLERLAIKHAQAGRLAPARAALEAAMRTAPPSPQLTHNLAVLDLLAGRRKQARAAFEQIGDRLPEALVNLGLIADGEGEHERAYRL
jgi:tetratricopeptide (TPR) repeat protein